MKYSEQRHKMHTLETCRAYLQSFENSSHYFWAILERAKGLGHIGNINAYVDNNNALADIGILIGQETSQNQHYGLEAWFGVCNYLFRSDGIRKLTAGTLSVNHRMIKLMRRSGMIKDGIRKRHYLYQGKETDIIHMALFRDQWENGIRELEEYLS